MAPIAPGFSAGSSTASSDADNIFDSMPKSVLNRWYADREDWLRRHGIDPKGADWKSHFDQLDPDLRKEFVLTFS